MASYSKSERAEALARLREWVKPGDTVYTILRHVSRSGMQREIGVVLLQPTSGVQLAAELIRAGTADPAARDAALKALAEPPIDLHPNHAVSRVLGERLGKSDGVIVGGCGMDMGFHLVSELSHTLYPEYACLGKGEDGRGRCPSNYHVNHHDRVRCPGDCHRVRIYRDPAAELPDWDRTREVGFHATPELRALDGWQHTYTSEDGEEPATVDLPFRYLAVTWGGRRGPEAVRSVQGGGVDRQPRGAGALGPGAHGRVRAPASVAVREGGALVAMRNDYCTTVYHSPEWASLVEQGWITMTVDARGIASMLRQRRTW